MPSAITRCCVFFFFNDTATTEIYTLSLHDALPICALLGSGAGSHDDDGERDPYPGRPTRAREEPVGRRDPQPLGPEPPRQARSHPWLPDHADLAGRPARYLLRSVCGILRLPARAHAAGGDC